MLAALYNGNRIFDLCDYTLPRISNNELLIKVNNCGICGTDRHIYEGKSPSKLPVILGHEYCGTIIKIGNSNSEYKVGDKVAVDPNIYCGKCSYCRRGMVSFCENLQALGVTLNGGFAENSIVPISQVYLLPDDFDLTIAAFAEPLSCCLRGIHQAEIKLGDVVVIIGGGSIGLMMIQLVKINGASKIILIEPDNTKRKIGIELGADHSLNSDDELLYEQLADLTSNQIDVVIECVGSENTVAESIKIAGKGAKVIIFGLTPIHQELNINLQVIFKKELKIINSYLNPFTFKTAVDLLINNKICVQKLISKQISIKEIPGFFSNIHDTGNIKVQLINN